ncbi:hypothetical protein AYO43_06890 [Nitrospira sp. SCGC AG-212-E16]|nr:hypothetical protein AYO43_06890 [Nitrospira sp. SCGC AG-212-E16]
MAPESWGKIKSVVGARKQYYSSHRAVLLVAYALLCGCTSMSGVHTRDAVCSIDNVWEAALDAVKNRSVTVKDKDRRRIETAWLEIPMPGRTVGASQEEVQDSKDRSRLILTVNRLDVEHVIRDIIRVFYVEERQRWAFQPDSRLFGWAETDPSEDMWRDVRSRLDAALKEHGCSIT